MSLLRPEPRAERLWTLARQLECSVSISGLSLTVHFCTTLVRTSLLFR